MHYSRLDSDSGARTFSERVFVVVLCLARDCSYMYQTILFSCASWISTSMTPGHIPWVTLTLVMYSTGFDLPISPRRISCMRRLESMLFNLSVVIGCGIRSVTFVRRGNRPKRHDTAHAADDAILGPPRE